MSDYDLHERAASIIYDAGGELVGRTRLQKVVYLTQLAGWATDFRFEYRHFGPFSEELADATQVATGLKLVKEDERRADWGGWYSVFSTEGGAQLRNEDRARFISVAAKVGAIELELAATAAYLHDVEGYGKGDDKRDPWEETKRRKPEKAGGGRIERAKAAYRKLQAIKTPEPLPQIA
jgi:uncharacterized protein YwgA